MVVVGSRCQVRKSVEGWNAAPSGVPLSAATRTDGFVVGSSFDAGADVGLEAGPDVGPAPAAAAASAASEEARKPRREVLDIGQGSAKRGSCGTGAGLHRGMPPAYKYTSL